MADEPIVKDPPATPPEIEHVGAVTVGTVVVVMQAVSDGLNPFPTIPTESPTFATFGTMLIVAVGEPTVKVAPANLPVLSFTLTR
jgi:hypothetical protein